jgi:hypothetical protein
MDFNFVCLIFDWIYDWLVSFIGLWVIAIEIC